MKGCDVHCSAGPVGTMPRVTLEPSVFTLTNVRLAGANPMVTLGGLAAALLPAVKNFGAVWVGSSGRVREQMDKDAFAGGNPHDSGPGNNFDKDQLSIPPFEGENPSDCERRRAKRQFVFGVLRKQGEENLRHKQAVAHEATMADPNQSYYVVGGALIQEQIDKASKRLIQMQADYAAKYYGKQK